MGLESLIKGGGKILVVGGYFSRRWTRFKDHPQIVWWNGSQSDIRRMLKAHNNDIPDNVHGVVMSRFISHSEARQIMEAVRKKRALMMAMNNDGEIARKLEEITGIKPVEAALVVETTAAPMPQPEAPVAPVELDEANMREFARGERKSFVTEHHESVLNTADEGRRLHKLAKQKGIKVSVDSMLNMAGIYRRENKIVVGEKAAQAQVRMKAKKPVDVEITGTKFTPAGIELDMRRVQLDPASTQTAVLTPPAPALTQAVQVANDTAEILRLIDDATATMALIKEHVLKLGSQNNEFAEIGRRMAAMFGTGGKA